MKLPTISTIPKIDEADFAHNLYEFRRSDTIDVELHTDRRRAAIWFWRVKEFIRSSSDRSRIQVLQKFRGGAILGS